MNTQITSSNAGIFLDRYCNFYDSIFESIALKYTNGQRDLRLAIKARDALACEDNHWVEVIVIIKGVRELTIREKPRTSMQVLLDGLHVHCFDDGVAVEFGGECDSPTTLEEYRNSDGYAIGREMEYYVE